MTIPTRAALLAAITLLLAPSSGLAAAPHAELPRSLVFFDEAAPGTAREFLEELREAGGHASVIYPMDAAVVYAGPDALAAVEEWISERHESAVDPSRFEARSERAKLLAAAWNQDLRWRAEGRVTQEPHGHAHSQAATPTAFPDARHVPVDLPAMPLRRDAPDHMPYGAEYYDTSAFLAGTVAVGVWLLESVGGAYDWSAAEEAETLAGIQQGLDNWGTLDTASAQLTFLLDVHTGVPVSDDPITYAQSTEATWIGQALTWAGWTGANAWEQCFAYNNALRDSFETNWCYSMFYADSDPAVNQGLFAGGGYAWAYYGGPWVYMSRYSTWAYNAANYHQAVPMHEMGHIFWNTDEYDGGVQQTQGYLNVPDSPNGSVICIMNQNVHTRICIFSKRQVGWRDDDGNGVMEPLDTPPDAALDALAPDPNPDTTPTWTGTATVTTLPNQNPNDRYFPPHAQTICTIAAVECRADGGAWSPATPTDGAFDAYVEGFHWEAPWLAPGVHVIEARAQSSRGIWTVAFGADTVDVQPPVGVLAVADAPQLRLEPTRPNPARDAAVIRYALPRETEVRVSIHSITGSRVRTLFDGTAAAGPHAQSWNGRDAAGRLVPAGVYLVRLESPLGVRSTKLTWQR